MKAGEFIRPIDDVGTFRIVKIIGAAIHAEDEDGFEHIFTRAEVVLFHKGDLEKSIQKKPVQKDHSKNKRVNTKSKKRKQKQSLEIDLHAGMLLGSTVGMSNHEILSRQVEHALNALQNARRQQIKYVVLIHGKGTGRLRQELHKHLKGKENLEFYDAEYSQFSSGATEVRLF